MVTHPASYQLSEENKGTKVVKIGSLLVQIVGCDDLFYVRNVTGHFDPVRHRVNNIDSQS